MPEVTLRELLPPAPPPAPPAPPLSWRKYPAKWLRTEKFWHEVVTRTVAGIIAGSVIAAGIYYIGITAGYFDEPSNVEALTKGIAQTVATPIVLGIGLNLISTAATAAFGWAHRRKARLKREKSNSPSSPTT